MPPSRPVSDEPPREETPPFASGLRVLVVDDEAAVAFVVERILQERGFDVTVTLSGKAALEALRANGRFHALVTDQTMPGMRGDEVARAALAIDPALRVLLMSGYSATVGPSQMAAAGIHGFVEKPFTREQFLVAMRRVVGEPAVK
jgi:CheY-like chemotaxis protein